MSKRILTKKKIKNIVITVLCTLLGVAAVFSVGSIIKNDTKTIGGSYFAIGGIDSDGEYVKQNYTLYTKDFIECQGLTIEPEYDAEASYQVFLYNQNKELVEVSDVLSGNYTMGNAIVQYARIMIIPTYEEDVELDAVTLNTFDIAKYAKSLNITVSKNQEAVWTDYFKENKDKENNGKLISGAVGDLESFVESEEDVSYVAIACGNASEFTVFASKGDITEVNSYFFVDADGKIIETDVFDDTETSFIIEVPSTAKTLYINYTVGDDLIVYRTR